MEFFWCRPSARFSQHRRKKRKEMDEGIPETNQHKQSNTVYFKILFDRKQFGSIAFFFLSQMLLSLILTFFLSLLLTDSYIIKLFDRSVDLAQFNTSTPLYPICRAWMRNNPSVREPVPYPSPTHSMAEEEVTQCCVCASL